MVLSVLTNAEIYQNPIFLRGINIWGTLSVGLILPTRLHDTGEFAFRGQIAETNPANAEFPYEGP
jgi:hypothetical protein